MEGIVFVALIMIVAWVVGNNRKNKSEHQEQSALTSEAIRLSIIEDLVRAQYNALDEVVSLHIKTLAKKYDMLTFTDDYGNENTARFKNEAEYFCKTVVPSDLIEEIGYDHAVVTVINMVQFKRYSLASSEMAYERDMRGEEFEALVESIFHRHGIATRRTAISGDQGVDLLAVVDEEIVAVQCKRSASIIGNKAVQEVVAGMIHYDAQKAWVVSDADFSPAARQLAKSARVTLLHYSEIEELIKVK